MEYFNKKKGKKYYKISMILEEICEVSLLTVTFLQLHYIVLFELSQSHTDLILTTYNESLINSIIILLRFAAQQER